ncbi:MAG: hypothetical protein ACOC1P_00895 [Minisyncoccales bacterium]
MRIKKHIHKDCSEIDSFGESSKSEGKNFYWYFGDNKIGLMPKQSVVSADFFRGILADEKSLFVYPKQQKIQRETFPKGKIISSDEGIKETSDLIKFLLNNQNIHMFFSSENQLTNKYILTFSLEKPSKEFYRDLEEYFVKDLQVVVK